MRFMQKYEWLRLTLDMSHWVLVSERLLSLETEPKLFEMIAPRTIHIHARIGTPQSPQIHSLEQTDKATIAKYEDVWKKIYERFGGAQFTITPEYGPGNGWGRTHSMYIHYSNVYLAPYEIIESSAERLCLTECQRLKSLFG